MLCKKEKAFRPDEPILYRAIITLGALRVNDGNDEQDMVDQLGPNVEESSIIQNPLEEKVEVKPDTPESDVPSSPVIDSSITSSNIAVADVTEIRNGPTGAQLKRKAHTISDKISRTAQVHAQSEESAQLHSFPIGTKLLKAFMVPYQGEIVKLPGNKN